jgi:hypothetical protein
MKGGQKRNELGVGPPNRLLVGFLIIEGMEPTILFEGSPDQI